MTRLMVLGLLRHKQMSGYEMQQFLQLGHVDQWAGILPGSIYHALKKLEKEGFVTVEAVENTGNRAKAIYRITEEGSQEYIRLIAEALAATPFLFPSDLFTGLLFHHDLPREQALLGLEAQLAGVQAKYAAAKAGQEQKRSLPAASKLVFDHMFELYEAHLQFLHRVKALLAEE
ncbi:PadR family transcriptional regulator [Paenibacillus chartarius]|uniref:PadR family transcriptional regulator n=1 Tax=Paenibacillus chartarius TaxID=747481 RepID=A0ABV6DUC7_9BACL